MDHSGARQPHGRWLRRVLEAAEHVLESRLSLHPDAQGKGYAAEMCEIAVECAHRTEPELPIVAYLLEHNVASAWVAERAGLELITRGPDVGNPDADAVRLVYADRSLTADQVDVVLSA
nr:GNAT family N-acetyltransferase [Rhodococcus sp. BS-15]